MHVISQRPLKEFWKKYPEAEAAMRRWLKIVNTVTWSDFADLRRTFPGADAFHRCVIFNVGGNKYRIIGAVHYNRNKLFIRHVLTHADYDRGAWKAECHPPRQGARHARKVRSTDRPVPPPSDPHRPPAPPRQ